METTTYFKDERTRYTKTESTVERLINTIKKLSAAEGKDIEEVITEAMSKKAGSKEFTLKEGVFYRTRDGRKAKIWTLNKGSEDKPVLGMILEESGQWAARYWNDKGICRVPYGATNDIVAEWSET